LVSSPLKSFDADAVLFYPQDSLKNQLAAWGGRHSQYRVAQSFAKALPEVRKALRGMSVAVVDATDDPSQAMDAFSQVVRKLGPYSALVYTERLHEGLELFVRVHGVLLLWGPLSDVQWDELLERTFEASKHVRSAKLVAGRFTDTPVPATANLEFQRL
jgi:hypothetical protein